MVDDTSTLLEMVGIGVPTYSARGLTQTLEPIGEAANARRTVNGLLVDLSYDPFRKYAVSLSCEDQRPPAVDGIWPGRVVTLQSVSELCYPVSGTPQRDVVSGSEHTEGDFVFYRPVLEMMVMSFSMDTDEWAAGVSWKMDLEEI